MYRPYRQSNNRFRSNNFRGNRPIKSFDPTDLVKNNIQSGPKEDPYIAVNSFEGFSIDETLKKNITTRGYTSPTPIQDQVIPHILTGKDVIGIANTGTGKTAAFLIPLIDALTKETNKKALIITPTRELAVQIKNEFLELSAGIDIYGVLAIGGVDLGRQKERLQRNPRIVIGTPGRLNDLIKRRILNLSSFNVIVLDEVDQMLDIGFIESIKYFISLLSPNRQSLFFSATVDGKVKEVLTNFVKNPVTVSVKKQDMLKNIKHDVIKLTDKSQKIEKLHDLLNQKEFEKVLIFGRTKWGVQKLSDELVKRGFNADVIHGNKRQSQRLRILDRFKRNEIQILLATDVASRGLDIDNVTHVINFDPPESYEVYIHRIGRTGRTGKEGNALTFV